MYTSSSHFVYCNTSNFDLTFIALNIYGLSVSKTNLSHLITFLLLASTGVWLAYVVKTSTGVYEDGDSIRHFQIAQASWQQPHLFLDRWGRPLNTLLMSPAAQLGFTAVLYLSVALLLITGYITYLCAKLLGLYNPSMAVVFLFSFPLYIRTSLSGLTEIPFAFLFSLLIWLLLKRKFLPALFLASFLPYARPEGGLILLLTFILALCERKYKELPFVLTGTLLMVIASYLLIGKVDYFETRNGLSSLYGSGEFLRFFNVDKSVFGSTSRFFFYLGAIYLLFKLLINPGKLFQNYNDKVWFLLLLSSLGVFFIHSYLWYRGWFGSMGLSRVLCTVMPATALICTYLLSSVSIAFYNRPVLKWSKAFLLSFLAFLLLRQPFKTFEMPKSANPQEQVINQVADGTTNREILAKHIICCLIWVLK